MCKKMFVVAIVFVVASLLAGCSRSMSTAPVSIPETPTTNVVGTEQPPTVSVEVFASEPEIQETEELVEEPAMKTAVLPDCPLEDKGLRLEFVGPNEGEFYLLSGLSQDFAAYEGCNFLFEGRQFLTEEHHIWVFESPDWQLKVREGSLWVYPRNWNMADFSAEKPPIAAEFVTAKRHNMLENGYDWLIFVHVGNDTYKFPAGATTPVVVLPDNAEFSEPQWISVHGIWDQQSTAFNASIGAQRATTVALLDEEELLFWDGAQDNILFQSVQAWLMPSTWDQSQIENWAKAQFPEMELQPYTP